MAGPPPASLRATVVCALALVTQVARAHGLPAPPEPSCGSLETLVAGRATLAIDDASLGDYLVEQGRYLVRMGQNHGPEGIEPVPPGCLSDVMDPEAFVCFPKLPLLALSDARKAGVAAARSFWLPLAVDENTARAIEQAVDRRVLLVFASTTSRRRSFDFFPGKGAARRRLTKELREARAVTLVIADDDRVLFTKTYR